MKASELIQEIAAQIVEHGDLPVILWQEDGFEEVSEALVVQRNLRERLHTYGPVPEDEKPFYGPYLELR
jgi:hypothetical protein